jgi:hypothetical protein
MKLRHARATASVELPLPYISAFTRVFDALWGEGWGEGVTGGRWLIERPQPLTPPLSLWEREQTECSTTLIALGPNIR